MADRQPAGRGRMDPQKRRGLIRRADPAPGVSGPQAGKRLCLGFRDTDPRKTAALFPERLSLGEALNL